MYIMESKDEFVFVDFFSSNTFCHLQLIYHMWFVLGD
jgi:hypothetical protein